jgi:KaiC/GvpD/RAD55 family RecA-like ATPase
MPAASLIGRERILAEVVDLVRDNRLVTLTGVGGVGKTRLSIEVGASLVDEFTDGVWMVELAALTEPDAVPDAIASTLGITPKAGTPVIRTLADVLSARNALVVLDNCEHVVGSVAEAVRELTSRSTALRVLATSREAIDVPGEQRRLVLPLGLEGRASSPAVTLFVERARALQSRIDFVEPATAAAVVEICRSLDGLPLGIELAAARTISMSPIDIRDRLGDRFCILTASPRAPRRQQTLRDVVAWSYELLDDDESALLRGTADDPALRVGRVVLVDAGVHLVEELGGVVLGEPGAGLPRGEEAHRPLRHCCCGDRLVGLDAEVAVVRQCGTGLAVGDLLALLDHPPTQGGGGSVVGGVHHADLEDGLARGRVEDDAVQAAVGSKLVRRHLPTGLHRRAAGELLERGAAQQTT